METRLISVAGMFLMLLLAWGLSLKRNLFPWRTVISGLALQFVFALIVLRTALGRGFFEVAQKGVNKLNDFAQEGARMVFGPLADSALLGQTWGAANTFVFAISITATIIVVSALSALFYHWGLLQRVVDAVAWVMQRVMKTSGSESFSAAANIFLGQVEAPLLIRPYLRGLTLSELLAVMMAGMASIAGGVLAVYASLGASSGHLITASVMSAPAALLISKIMLPETEVSSTAGRGPGPVESPSRNSIDALCLGASEGMTTAIHVMAMLIAFVAVVAMLNYLLSHLTRPFGVSLTMQEVLGWVNAPIAWLIGVPAKDCLMAGQILGERIVLNEFFGYLTLTKNREALDPRTFTLITYALCGFANFGSVAIQIGGIAALAPERRKDLAFLGIRAMVGGLLACYLTATVVGILT